jgi:multiple antibiotic resistance protein
MSLVSATVLFFFVMDPLGNIPLFISALKNVDAARRRRVIVRELLIALGILVAFLFAGQLLLGALQVSTPALKTAGGVILLLIALRMIFPSSEHSLREELSGEPFVVPLAIPYTAGPSTLATELLLMKQAPERWPVWLAAVALAWLGGSVILYFADGLRRRLGERGLIALERLMGMLLITVAVEMLFGGVRAFLGR